MFTVTDFWLSKSIEVDFWNLTSLPSLIFSFTGSFSFTMVSMGDSFIDTINIANITDIDSELADSRSYLIELNYY